MFQYRQVLVRLRAGDSVREVARSGLMGQHCQFVLHMHRAKLSRLLRHWLEWRVRAVICTALRASRSGLLCSANRFWPLRRAGP